MDACFGSFRRWLLGMVGRRGCASLAWVVRCRWSSAPSWSLEELALWSARTPAAAWWRTRFPRTAKSLAMKLRRLRRTLDAFGRRRSPFDTKRIPLADEKKISPEKEKSFLLAVSRYLDLECGSTCNLELYCRSTRRVHVGTQTRLVNRVSLGSS